MSHTRLKTTYEAPGAYGSAEIHALYVWHGHSSDCITFYDENGQVSVLNFEEWGNNDKLSAIQNLLDPYEG